LVKALDAALHKNAEFPQKRKHKHKHKHKHKEKRIASLRRKGVHAHA